MPHTDSAPSCHRPAKCQIPRIPFSDGIDGVSSFSRNQLTFSNGTTLRVVPDRRIHKQSKLNLDRQIHDDR